MSQAESASITKSCESFATTRRGVLARLAFGLPAAGLAAIGLAGRASQSIAEDNMKLIDDNSTFAGRSNEIVNVEMVEGKASAGGDAAIEAQVPTILQSHGALLAALDAVSRAQDRFYGLRGERPAEPKNSRPSWWSEGVPIINGEVLPVSSEAEWVAYDISCAKYDANEIEARRNSGLDAANHQVDLAMHDFERCRERLLATRASSLSGMARKLSLVGEIVDPNDPEGCEEILYAIAADIEAAIGTEIVPLSVISTRSH